MNHQTHQFHRDNFSIRLGSVVAGLICAISGNGAEPSLTASSPSSFLSEPKILYLQKSSKCCTFGNSLPSPSNPTKDICSGNIDGCDWFAPPTWSRVLCFLLQDLGEHTQMQLSGTFVSSTDIENLLAENNTSTSCPY